jgi:16S rRNA processing protein RimM
VTVREEDLLAVGQIVKPVGIRGEVAVRSLSDTAGRFRSLRRAKLGVDPGHTRDVRIERATEGPRGVRMKLKDVDDRTAAEALAGQYLFVDPANRVRLPRGRFFVHQIVGLSVVDSEGRSVGIVRGVMKFPANDVFVIDHLGREVLIPVVKEFILAIEPHKGTIAVRLIEGMLEE